MRIYADFDAYVDRQDDDDWPDVWHEVERRWFRPHKLTLQFRQRPEDEIPKLVRASGIAQKRWANSNRLTDRSTWYSVQIWEVDGPVPEWLRPYVSEALSRISPARVEAGR